MRHIVILLLLLSLLLLASGPRLLALPLIFRVKQFNLLAEANLNYHWINELKSIDACLITFHSVVLLTVDDDGLAYLCTDSLYIRTSCPQFKVQREDERASSLP